MDGRSLRRAAIAAVVVAFLTLPETRGTPTTSVLGEAPIPRALSIDLHFPVGWYDALDGGSAFSDMAAEGMNSVLPYGTGDAAIASYLTLAAASGSSVYIPIVQAITRNGDVAGVTAFVNKFKNYSGLAGWYLADEPTMSNTMTPANGELLYNAIKTADPLRPVAIAFAASEDADPYRNAMDVMMWDWYPCRTGSPEFADFERWHGFLASAAAHWRVDHRFVPIIQAFGGASTRFPEFRLPTAAEERYMVYGALQSGVDGMFFWARYTSDPQWRTSVLDPLMAEVRTIMPAVKAGALRARLTSSTLGFSTALFRDPSTKRFVLLMVHNAETTTSVTISLPRWLPGKRHSVRAKLGPFGVRVVRL